MSNMYLGNLWTFFLRANFSMNVYIGFENLTAIILQVGCFPERDPLEDDFEVILNSTQLCVAYTCVPSRALLFLGFGLIY